MLGYRKPTLFLSFACVSAMPACISIVEGNDEVADADTETETDTGTHETSNETDADPDPDAETSTATETDAQGMGECEYSFEAGASDQDCSFAVTCTDQVNRSVVCTADGCACLEADAEVSSCSESLGICAAHDVGAIQGCCGWQL